MNHESQGSLRAFLNVVARHIESTELDSLKFICKGDIANLKREELAGIKKPLDLFDFLLDEHLIKESDLNYLVQKLDEIKSYSLSKKVQNYCNSIEDGNHNSLKPKLYGCKEKKFPFLGRDSMVNDIVNQFIFNNKKMVVILGPPGFGKSEVVNHIGHQLYERGLFSVVFVCMRQITTLNALCESILKAIDPNYSKANNVVDQAKNFLISLEAPAVLILDNCEDIQNSTSKQDFQKFIEYVGSYAIMVKLLLGTRSEITTYEFKSEPIKIQPLQGNHPANLLKIHAPELIDADAKKLAEACSGVPLLIFLAGKRVNNGSNPSKLAKDLKANPYDLLKAEEYLCNALTVFLNSLDIDLRCALVMLANFASSFTEEDVHELYIKDSCDCSNMLFLLCKNALLQHDNGHYSIHPLIQTFCREGQNQISCTEKGQNTKDAFNVHFFNKLENIHRQFESKEFSDALKAYEDNKMNIEQARQNAIKSGCKEIKVRCIDAYNNSVNILAKVMDPRQCHTIYHELHKEASELGDTKQIAKCNVSIGFRYLLDCNHLEYSEVAFDSLHNAYELFQKLHRKERETEAYAHCLSKLGLCYWLKNKRKEGKNFMQQAADVRHRLGDKVMKAAGYCDKANAAMADGEFLNAVGTLKDNCCSTYQSELGDHPWLATILNYMSTCNVHLNKLDDAIENIKESLEIRIRTLGDHQDTARSYVLLAELWQEKDELEKALDACKKALTIQKKVLEYHDETINTLETCAKILKELQRIDEHTAMVEEAEQYKREHHRRKRVQSQISQESKVRSNSHLEHKEQEQINKRIKVTLVVVFTAFCMLALSISKL